MRKFLLSKTQNQNLIVFIHGLFGSEETWIPKKSSHKTIYSYLYVRLYKEYDFAVHSYEAILENRGTGFWNLLKSEFLKFRGKREPYTFNLPVEENANLLDTQLKIYAERYKNIVLVGHSMGGLISKAYICQKILNNEPHKISHFISLAVPHNGSEFVTYAKYLLTKHPQIENLSPLNGFLDGLTKTWIDPDHHEKLPNTYYVAGSYDKTVVKVSAVSYESRKTNFRIDPVAHDHSSVILITGKNGIFDTTVGDGILQFLKEDEKKIAITNPSGKDVSNTGKKQTHISVKINMEISVSYPWENADDSQEKMVDDLYESLKKDNYSVISYKNDLAYGELITVFIERMAQVGVIILVLNDKYMKSNYCMYELFEAFRYSKLDKRDFSDRIFPIYTEQIDFSPKGRTEYRKYWNDEKAEWDKYVKEHTAFISPSEMEQYARIRAIPDKLGTIFEILNDINTPSADLLSRDNFAEIKKAIDVRIASLRQKGA